MLSSCSQTHRIPVSQEFRESGNQVNFYTAVPQKNIGFKKSESNLALQMAVVVAGAAAGFIVIPIITAYDEKLLKPIQQAVDGEKYKKLIHQTFVKNVQTLNWINFSDHTLVTIENQHLTKVGSYKNKNLKGEKFSLIINSSYNLSRDYNKLEFNAHVTLNKINYRPNKTNLNHILYQNSYRYISQPKQLIPRTQKENEDAAKAIEDWYQLEYSKLGTQMTSKRKEKLASLNKLKNHRLKSEVGELNDKAKRIEYVDFWANNNAIEVEDFIIQASDEISRMILLDIQDSRTFEQLKADPLLISLTGGAKLISSDKQRILVRTFGIGTEGRLCSLPKSIKLKNCLG